MVEGNSLFKRTLEALPDGVLLTSASRKVVYANAAFARHWKIPSDLLASRDEIALLHFVTGRLADPDNFYQEVERLHHSSEITRDEILFKDGRVFSRRSVPFEEDGALQARIWIFSDITEARNATLDILTGLPNRRAYTREFPSYVQSPDDGFFRAVSIMDVDNFKSFNDTYGHAAGDEVLRQLGCILLSCLSNVDNLVFRVGGEEFLMACRSRTKLDAVTFFESVRKSVEMKSIPHSGDACFIMHSLLKYL